MRKPDQIKILREFMDSLQGKNFPKNINDECLSMVNAITLKCAVRCVDLFLDHLVEFFPSHHDIWDHVIIDQGYFHSAHISKVLDAFSELQFNDDGLTSSRFYVAPVGTRKQAIIDLLHSVLPEQTCAISTFPAALANKGGLRKGDVMLVGKWFIEIKRVWREQDRFIWNFRLDIDSTSTDTFIRNPCGEDVSESISHRVFWYKEQISEYTEQLLNDINFSLKIVKAYTDIFTTVKCEDNNELLFNVTFDCDERFFYFSIELSGRPTDDDSSIMEFDPDDSGRLIVDCMAEKLATMEETTPLRQVITKNPQAYCEIKERIHALNKLITWN